MKKRIEKKMEKRRRDKIHELLDLTLDINSTMPREQAITGNQPTVFFWFHGHTGDLEIQIYKVGWSFREESKEEVEAYTDCKTELNQAINQMKHLKQQLCKK